MSGIWLLSTRGRPKDAQATIDACEAAGMTEPGVVYVDETTKMYEGLRLPSNWAIHFEPEWRSLQGSLQWCFGKYPNADYYGWLADDNRPRTKDWDKMLAQTAGRFGLSYAADDWQSNDPHTEGPLYRGENMTSGLCWGGDLVRAVGWWALPNVRQAGIDTAWLDIVRPLGLAHYNRHVLVEHLNWRTGKRPKDEGDSWDRPGLGDYINRDIATKNRWKKDGGDRQAQERIIQAMRDLGVASHYAQ